MPAGLWTPDGVVAINKGQQELTPFQIKVLSAMHDVAHQVEHMEIRCTKCGQGFHGQNNDTARTFSIACGCRELVYRPTS